MLNYRDTLDSNTSARDLFLEAMLASGIYLLPDGRWYLSMAHTPEDVARTIDSVETVLLKHKAKLMPVHTS
jgi:glutamate-1-semialdehyde 2,1-aminomutase